MPTYPSRHRPRRQTLVLGNIRNPDRYDRYYDIACDALARGALPTMMLPVGRLLVRVADSQWDAQACRTIPPGSSLKLDVRFNGRRPSGEAGVGALYVGTVAGVLREHAHYALGNAQPLWVPGRSIDAKGAFIASQKAGASSGGKRFHLYRLAKPLVLADFRAAALWRLLLPLLKSDEARSRYGFAPDVPVDFAASAVNDGADYSAARGLADAVADDAARRGGCGVCALSSRADRDDGLVVESHGDPTGGCVFALFGSDGQRIEALEPAEPTCSFGTFAQLSQALAALA